MQYDLVRELNPTVLRQNSNQSFFHGFRCFLPDQIQTLADAKHVSINHHAPGDTKARAKHDVRRLARRPGHGQQVIHVGGHLAGEIRKNSFRRANNTFRLVIEESGGADVLRQHFRGYAREVFNGRVFLEQARRHHIHPHVGALRREDGGYQQFPGIGMMKRASCVRIQLIQDFEDSVKARLALGCIFRALHGAVFLKRSGSTS